MNCLVWNCLQLCGDLSSGAALNVRNIKYAGDPTTFLVLQCCQIASCELHNVHMFFSDHTYFPFFFNLTWSVCYNVSLFIFSPPMQVFCLSFLPCLQYLRILILVFLIGPGLRVVFKNADLWRCHNSSMSWVSTLPPSLSFSFSCICDDKHYSCLTHTQLCYLFLAKGDGVPANHVLCIYIPFPKLFMQQQTRSCVPHMI